jgi:hypothetical protein
MADLWMLFPTEEEYLQWFKAAGFTDIKLKRIGPSWYRGVRRHGLIMGCSVTATKPAPGSSPLELGPKAEASGASNTNPLAFLLRVVLGSVGGAVPLPLPPVHARVRSAAPACKVCRAHLAALARLPLLCHRLLVLLAACLHVAEEPGVATHRAPGRQVLSWPQPRGRCPGTLAHCSTHRASLAPGTVCMTALHAAYVIAACVCLMKTLRKREELCEWKYKCVDVKIAGACA